MPKAAFTPRGARSFPLMGRRWGKPGPSRDRPAGISAQERCLTKMPLPLGLTLPPPPGTPQSHIPSRFPGSPTSLPAAVTSRNIFGSSCRLRGDAWPCPRSRPRNVEQTSPPTPGISDVPARRRFGMATAARPGWGLSRASPLSPSPRLCTSTSCPAGGLGLVWGAARGERWGMRSCCLSRQGWEQR